MNLITTGSAGNKKKTASDLSNYINIFPTAIGLSYYINAIQTANELSNYNKILLTDNGSFQLKSPQLKDFSDYIFQLTSISWMRSGTFYGAFLGFLEVAS